MEINLTKPLRAISQILACQTCLAFYTNVGFLEFLRSWAIKSAEILMREMRTRRYSSTLTVLRAGPAGLYLGWVKSPYFLRHTFVAFRSIGSNIETLKHICLAVTVSGIHQFGIEALDPLRVLFFILLFRSKRMNVVRIPP